jgi:hypothetical protein
MLQDALHRPCYAAGSARLRLARPIGLSPNDHARESVCFVGRVGNPHLRICSAVTAIRLKQMSESGANSRKVRSSHAVAVRWRSACSASHRSISTNRQRRTKVLPGPKRTGFGKLESAMLRRKGARCQAVRRVQRLRPSSRIRERQARLLAGERAFPLPGRAVKRQALGCGIVNVGHNYTVKRYFGASAFLRSKGGDHESYLGAGKCQTIRTTTVAR